MRPPPEGLVITGATGTGKSRLAVRVAARIDGEIISADSRQLYRHMDIGTAKPPLSVRENVPHHGLDLIEPDEAYSAGRFARGAWEWIAQIRERGRTPMIVGGSGLFIRALLDPLAPEPRAEPERRDRLRRQLSTFSVDRLRRWLERLDPSRARQLAAEGGRQRLARSLEVVLLSGRGHSWWHRAPPERRPLVPLTFCLALEREALSRRLDARFDQMLADGLLDEVRSLLERYGRAAPGLKSVGYAELVAHLRGEIGWEATVERAKLNTRRFARRQLTWFRHQLPAEAVWLDADRDVGELAERIVAAWEERRYPTKTGCGPP